MASLEMLSRGPQHHFYGYYGICPWDRSGRYHLALETDFHERPPLAGDSARVGVIDAGGEFVGLAETRAFNLQQGSMLHWIDVGRGEELTFNDWEDGRVVSRALDFATGRRRTLGAAIAGISPNGRVAIGLDFRRMYRCRKVVGYAHETADARVTARPEDDGLFFLDLTTGEARLLLSVAEVCRHQPIAPSEGLAWLDHVCFNPSGERLMFMCRVKRQGGWHSSLWTVNADGSDLACQIGYAHWISHFAWRDEERLVISCDVLGKNEFVIFTDGRGDFARYLPGIMPHDGHASFSPDGRWLVTDAYRRAPEWTASVMAVELATERVVDLGSYAQPPHFQGDIRCDLHPRFDRESRAVTFDSIHEGSRQIYRATLPD